MSPRRPTSLPLDLEERRKLGIALFNYTWTLLEKPDRSERETELMIDSAHASRLFWDEPGGPEHHARSNWQVSRVYATVGRAEPALRYGQQCLDICQAHGIGDWDLAYAYEALARASALAGDWNAAPEYEQAARDAANEITAAADRRMLLDDLATLPQRDPA